jgi:hypothetical protein
VYSGAVDPYGPVDPSVTVAVADAKAAAAEHEESRTDLRLAISGGVPSSASAQPVRGLRHSPEVRAKLGGESQPNPSRPRVRRAGAA